MEKEYILCAANHYNDGKKHTFAPKNIEIGFVVCGRRHHNCIEIFAMIVGFPYSESSLEIRRSEEQGFLTNTDRFVNRKEAYAIAIEAGQVSGNNVDIGNDELYSEDLY
jgi:hypothetical protein